MKIKRTVTLTFEVDVEAWADDFDVPVADVAADFTDALERNAAGIPEAVMDTWRALQGLATVTVSVPGAPHARHTARR